MKKLLFSTQNAWIGLMLRVSLGVIMFPHGAQKLFGMFGGSGYRNTMDYFIHTMKLPWIVAFLVVIIEFFGSIALIAGFAGRVWAMCFLILMIGAIYTTNFQFGFFMNWFGNQAGEGYEYHLLVIGICLAMLISGSGKLSVDLFMYR